MCHETSKHMVGIGRSRHCLTQLIRLPRQPKVAAVQVKCCNARSRSLLLCAILLALIGCKGLCIWLQRDACINVDGDHELRRAAATERFLSILHKVTQWKSQLQRHSLAPWKRFVLVSSSAKSPQFT